MESSYDRPQVVREAISGGYLTTKCRNEERYTSYTIDCEIHGVAHGAVG